MWLQVEEHAPWDGMSFVNLIDGESATQEQQERFMFSMKTHCLEEDFVPLLGADRRVRLTDLTCWLAHAYCIVLLCTFAGISLHSVISQHTGAQLQQTLRICAAAAIAAGLAADEYMLLQAEHSKARQ